MIYLLDASIYSQPLKRHPLATVVARWKRAGDGACAISIFCELEVLQGIAMSGSERLCALYETVLRDRIPILPFTRSEAQVYADLQAAAVRTGTTRPVIDLCIAATAITHRLTLVTLNKADFDGIAGLDVVSWG